jgi:NAD(P)H-dependent FMN reductase
MAKPTLQIIIGSTRPGRVGKPVADWFHEHAVKHGGFEAELIDLAEVNLPLLDEPRHPRFAEYEHEHTKAWSRRISAGDAYVFVVPEYNHGYNAATKNAIDYLNHEWTDKPVGFVSYGGIAAGTRAVEMLIQVVSVLGMVPLPIQVNIPLIGERMTADHRFTANEVLDNSAQAMLAQLSRWAARLGSTR